MSIWTLTHCLICSGEGYEEYLKQYPFKKGFSADYVNGHKDSFTGNCYKLNHRIKNGGIGEVTSLLDWNGDELEELGNLSVTYSGISSSYEVIDVKEKEYSIQKSSREFQELAEYNSPEKKCATSWVSATIELAEMALDHKVRLSTQQLFECLPKDEGIDGCDGVNMKTLSNYLSETGLMSENNFKNCESIDPLYTYRFSSISPEVPTGGGLMNLMFDEKKSVMVLVALSLDKLRFVKDMSNMDEGYKCGGYQPSMYGLLTGYNYSGDEDSWWEIRSRVVPGEEIVLKLPMSLDMTTANYGGIAAYAFTLRSIPRETVFSVNEKDFPSIESIPDYVTELVFVKNSYSNAMYLDLSRFSELEKVTVENGAFANADSLYISNPYMIESVIGDGCFNGKYDTGRRLLGISKWYESHSRGLIIHDGRKLKSLIIGMGSMITFENIRLIHVSVDISIRVGTGSLNSVNQIEIPVKGSVDEDVETVSRTIEQSIMKGNTEVVVIITITEFVPTEEDLEIPTYPPTERPTENITVIPVVTQQPSESILTSEVPTERITETPTIIPSTIVPTEKMTEILTIIPTTGVPTERMTEVSTEIPSTSIPTPTPTSTPTPTPGPWFPIYDPFILGDNTNYEKQETCFDEIISDIAVLKLYLAIRDAYPAMALAHTRVIALSGMTTDAVYLWHASLSKQTLNPSPIDMYFYSDYQTKRYVDVTLAVPLISLSQYTRPSRIVFVGGTFKREGMNEVLQWMVDNRDKGYFINLKFFQIIDHMVGAFQDGATQSYADELKEKIGSNLATMCSDKVNFPKLEEFNFNQNSYNEYNNGFDVYLSNACSKNATGVRVRAREVTVNIPPMCKTGDDTNHDYYDMEDEKEIAQCRHTWNWEYLVNPKYTTTGPYPNNDTLECDEERPVIPSTTTSAPTMITCKEYLIVSSESDCAKLSENGWRTITVNEGLCNELHSDLIMSDNPCLQEIIVKRNSLKHVSMLKISNNILLNRIEIEDGTLDDGAFNNVKNATVTSCMFYE